MAQYRFQARWVPTVATLLVLPALLALGFWQLDRARQKSDLLEARRSQAALPVIEIAGLLDPTVAEFRIARAEGEYEPRWQILLDNRIHRGRSGVEVLTPLRLPGGTWLLVNRGWVPWGPERSVLPEAAAPQGTVAVGGRLRVPPEFFTLERGSARNEFKTLWQNLDLERYQELTGLTLQPLVLELAATANEAGGFVRDWASPKEDWVNRHRGYAFQWFALAVTLLLLYLVLNMRQDTDN